MDIWDMIAEQRHQLTVILDDLDETQWQTQSLCPDWTVREVAGHLITPFELGTARLLLRLVGNRFNFNQTMSKAAKQLAQRPTRELVGTLRANAESHWTPPGLGPEAPLTDIVMHTQDICYPLGIQQPIEAERARRILDLLTSGKVRIIADPTWIDGLRLAPTDLDWAWGEGPEIKGTAAAVLMAIGGRPGVLDDLSGDGADELRRRLANR